MGEHAAFLREGGRYERHDYSERRAGALVGLNRRTFRRPVPADADNEVRQRLRELAQALPRFGSPRLHVLLRREGLVKNHKRAERLYREEGLSLRMKRRKKRPSHLHVVMPVPDRADQSWQWISCPMHSSMAGACEC
jgi:putative transposase